MNATTPTIQLQSIGKVRGKVAGDLKVGDVILWNFGYTSVVETIEFRGKSVYTTLRSSDGKVYDRRFLQSRVVGISTRK